MKKHKSNNPYCEHCHFDETQNMKEAEQKIPHVTQIFSNVMVHIKNNDAFRLYSFLRSKSQLCSGVDKEWIAKKCGLSEKKARQCWSYLRRCGLIRYINNRDEKGRISKHNVEVLIGDNFNPEEPFLALVE